MKLGYVFMTILSLLMFARSELQGPPDSQENDSTDSNQHHDEEDDQDLTSNERKASKTLPSEEEVDHNYKHFLAVEASMDAFYNSIKGREAEFLKVGKIKDLKNKAMSVHDLETTVNKWEEEKKNAPKPELTAHEIEAQNLYNDAVAIFNKTSADKAVGYAILRRAAALGHIQARAEVAWAEMLGHYMELNIESAKNTFFQLVDTGLPEAHLGVGFMYATGIGGVNISQPKAIVHYTLAALGDNTWAQMALGYRYSFGLTVSGSCEKALDHYRKVAKKVASRVTFSGGPAIHRVRLLDEIESSGGLESDLIEYYQLLADKGDVQSQIGLGQLYYQGGRSTPQDHRKALDYFTQASNAGNAVGYAFLGKIYLEGSEHINASNDTAFKYFKKAAELGNPVGQSGLGIMYLQGRGVPKDTTKALNYFTQAADQGWVDGQLQLGNMYFNGEGVKMDFKLALKYFNLASQSGHVLAYYNLGLMHSFGLGMMRSCPAAVEFFKNVAERGRWSERLMHAYHDYRNSYHVNEAFMQYALLAEAGYEVAQSNAAFLLDRNEMNLFHDRTEALVRAFRYWKLAAHQGYSAAQVKLGDYYYYGLGTAVDYETAASLYRKASEQQYNAQAMFNLGYMHEQGLGMKKDWHLAKRLYDLAAETNSDAKVPVALALLKLQFLVKMESLKDTPFQFVLHLDENIASNWDLYLITVLTLVLGMIMYTRRPTQNQPNQAEQPGAGDGGAQGQDDLAQAPAANNN